MTYVCIFIYFSISIFKEIFAQLFLGYFSCTQAGSFADIANCALGRYFYCPPGSSGKYISKIIHLFIIILIYILVPITATCPAGQKFNPVTSACNATYNCT